MSEPLIREEVERRINEFIATHEMVPRSRYDACNKDWLEAQERITQVQRAAAEEIAVLTARVEQVTALYETIRNGRSLDADNAVNQLTWHVAALTDERDALKDERDEMRRYHDNAIEALYDTLGIDTSDGEIRFKWVHLAVSDLKQQVADLTHKLAESEQGRSEMAQLATENNLRGVDGFGEHL